MKYFRFWAPVILWMAVIFLFSSREKVALTDSYALGFLFFKALHLIEFIFLYFVCFRAFFNTGVSKDRAYVYAFLIAIFYAATDEIHQRFVPTREGRIRDVIIDAIGGGLGWIFLTQLLPKAPKSLKNLAKKWQLL